MATCGCFRTAHSIQFRNFVRWRSTQAQAKIIAAFLTTLHAFRDIPLELKKWLTRLYVGKLVTVDIAETIASAARRENRRSKGEEKET